MVIFGNLGILQRSCVLCLGHLKVKQSSYTISDLPTSPSHVWGRLAGFRSMPKDFCWFENVIGRCLTVFLFIYKDLGGSASSSRGQHHPECLFGLTQVRLRSGGAWSEASGDFWEGQGWHKSCSYWSPLMFGSVWDCLTLIWNHFAKAHLPPTSQQTISPFPEIVIGFEALIP